jgi:hypothetical protein
MRFEYQKKFANTKPIRTETGPPPEALSFTARRQSPCRHSAGFPRPLVRRRRRAWLRCAAPEFVSSKVESVSHLMHFAGCPPSVDENGGGPGVRLRKPVNGKIREMRRLILGPSKLTVLTKGPLVATFNPCAPLASKRSRISLLSMFGLPPAARRFWSPIATVLLRKSAHRAPLEVRCCRTPYC